MIDALQGNECGVREGVDEWIGRPHLVAVADDHEDRARDPAQLIGGHRNRGTAEACRQRLGVVPGRVGEAGEGLGKGMVGDTSALDGLGNRIGGLFTEEVGADAADHDAPEAPRPIGGQREHDARAEREADRIHLAFAGKDLYDPLFEGAVRGGVVRLRRLAVPEEVDRDDLASGIREEVDPARLPPVALERRREAVDEQDGLGAHGLHRISLSTMCPRIDIELTSARDDGTWTWRAAGARQPKGVVDASLLTSGAKVGDVLRAEADFEIEGITITSILPPKEKKAESNRLEIIGPRVSPGVTTSLQPKRPGAPRDRDRDRDRDRSRDREGRPPRDRDARPPRERKPRGERPPRAEPQTAPPKPKPRKLNPASTHRNAVLDSLAPEHRPIAEQVLRGGLPAVRQAVEAQNTESRAEGKPEVSAAPLIAIAEELLPRLKTAEWLDRAEAASEHADEISIRDLRSVVASADTASKDESARRLATTLREALDRRLTTERDQWIAEVTSALDEGRLVRALRISGRSPDPSARFPAELATRLSDAASEAMTADVAPERWATVLDAVASSPVRRSVKPVALPNEPGEELLQAARAAAGRVPALAPMLGIEMPPPPGPPKKRGPRRPRPAKAAAPPPPPPPPRPIPPPPPTPSTEPETASETH